MHIYYSRVTTKVKILIFSDYRETGYSYYILQCFRYTSSYFTDKKILNKKYKTAFISLLKHAKVLNNVLILTNLFLIILSNYRVKINPAAVAT